MNESKELREKDRMNNETIRLQKKQIEQLKEVLWAKDQLLVCYRLGGRRPTDKVMKILDKWDEAGGK